MTPSLRLVSICAAAGALALAATPARAQDAAAEVLFRDGDRLMDEGKLAEACDAFEASNRIEPRAGTLIRLGDCREKNQQLASAWSAYSDGLARAKDPAKQEVALAKVKGLEPRLSRLTIAVARPVAELAITRGGVPVDRALWGRAVPVDGGEYAIKATALGFETWETTVAVPVEGGAITVDVPVLKDAPLTVAPRNPVVSGGELTTTAIAPNREGGGGLSGRRKIAIGLAAGGAVLLGAGVIFGLQARALESDAQEACPEVTCVRAGEANDLLSRAQTRATLANAGYGAGGLALAAGVVFWFLGGSSSTGGVAVVPHGAGAALVGRF